MRLEVGLILKRLELGQLGANCYIIGSEKSKEGIIIDPGSEPEVILDNVKDMGLKIKTIVLTHGHWDHTDALGSDKKATGAVVAIHPGDAGRLKDMTERSGWGSPNRLPLPAPDMLLKDGDTVGIDDISFSVIHTPGHSPGSICLYGHGIIFTGDTLFNGGIGRFDFPGGNYDQEMASLHDKLMTLPDEIVVYPGHGPESTIGTERKYNPFLNQ
jgi:hydroxyacylglutathione hydrolase